LRPKNPFLGPEESQSIHLEYPKNEMARRPPTLEGFRVLFRLPSLGLAEIAWRWALGAAFLASFSFAILQYLNSLPVTAADLLMLRTRHPLIVSRAIAHILAGSASRFLAAMIVLAMALGFAWIVVAAVGRAVTLKSLVIYFFPNRDLPLPIGPLIGLNSLRAAVALAAIVASFGGLLLAGAVSPKNDPSPGSAILIFLTLGLFVWLFWATLNWLLSLAAVFAVAERATTLGAIVGAVDLLRQRPGAIVAASIWFGLAHAVAYVVASSMVAFPLAFTGFLPGGIVVGGVIVTTLIYFAIVDYLYVGRLAAYLSIAESPEIPQTETLPLPPAPYSEARVDPGELILSDLPLGGAPA
jgi:hypothetical protein